MSGLFISFEGGEGGGKSTQVAKLAAWLESQGQSPVVTRQPGGTAYGKRIRELILTPNADEQLSSRAELFLYLADRAHHVDTVIRPALNEGYIVLCDRYTDSTLAYQGYGRQLNVAELQLLNDLATQYLKPDHTFWFDLDPQVGLTRIQVRAGLDRLEQEAAIFHDRVRNGYATLAAADPERWVRVDAAQNPDVIFTFLCHQLTQWCPQLRL